MTGLRTHYVYEAYDADGLLLYVGCTSNPTRRYREHMSGSPGGRKGWFGPFVTRWAVSGPYEKATALRIEAERIAERRPVWNGLPGGLRPEERERRISDYLAYHGFRFEPHPTKNAAVLVRRRRSNRRLRSVA